MPIYEYRCESCAGNFEVLTSFAERDSGQACPTCTSKQTKVLVSSFATAGHSDSAGDLDFSSAGGGCCGGGCGSCGGSVN